MTQTCHITIQDRIATIVLNRPDRLNAINSVLLADFADCLDRANGSDDVDVVVLRGEGRAFCAGDDLKEFDQQARSEAETRRYIEEIQNITRRILFSDRTFIAAVHGWAVGGGLEWMLNCDLVVMAHDTRCFFPEVSLGIFVTGAVTHLLPRQIGLPRTKALLLLGERFDAQQAQAWGLTWTLTDQATLVTEAQALAERLVALPKGARINVKRVLHTAAEADISQAMALETDATVAGFLDPESRERAKAALKT